MTEEKKNGKMKILGMNCSPRKVNSYGILKMMQKSIGNPDVEMEILNLGDYKIKQCLGNLKCQFQEPYECIIKNDDIPFLKKKFAEFDGYVFVIPNYVHTVPGIFKDFMDRCVNWVHLYPFIGKYAAIIASSAAPAWFNEDLLMEMMRQWLVCLGIRVSGELSVALSCGYKELEPILAPMGLDVPVDEVPGLKEKLDELTQRLVTDMIEKPQFVPDAWDYYHFYRMKILTGAIGGNERKRFEENNWYEKEHWSL